MRAAYCFRRNSVAVAILMLSNGTAMLVMGDEFLNTQHGNNNPYNQDNPIVWLNWDRKQQFPDMFRFFKLMIQFRKKHPSLGCSRFWRDDVKWYGTSGPVDFSPHSRTLVYSVNGASVDDDDIYVMMNFHWEAIDFTNQENGVWRLVVDTGLTSPADINEPGQETLLHTQHYTVQARSLVVLLRRSA